MKSTRVPSIGAPSSPDLHPDRFREAIGHFASGVTVITTVEGGRLFGTTANAFSSLSLEPPMLLIALNRSSETGAAIERVRRFAVNVLAEDQAALARRFAGKGDDKFDGVARIEGQRGMPLLLGALACFECAVAGDVEGGTHTVFLARVESAIEYLARPLAYWRGQFGSFEPVATEAAEGELEESLRSLAAIELAAAAHSIGQLDDDVLEGAGHLLDLLDRSEPDESDLATVLSVRRRFGAYMVDASGVDSLSRAHARIRVDPPTGGPARRARLSDLLEIDRRLLDAHRDGQLDEFARYLGQSTEWLISLAVDDSR